MHFLPTLSLTLLFCNQYASAGVGPSQPVPIEEQDEPPQPDLTPTDLANKNKSPAEAFVATHNITCLGGNVEYPFSALYLGDRKFDPKLLSMQEFCAKAQYGGINTHINAGAFCKSPPAQDLEYGGLAHTGEVAFDVSVQGMAAPNFQHPRMVQTCFYRCFCSDGLADPSAQPKTLHPHYRTRWRPSAQNYQLTLDVADAIEVPPQERMGNLGQFHVQSSQVESSTEYSPAQGAVRNDILPVSLDPQNKIQCKGDLPTFRLPPPYDVRDFRDVQHLCATQWNNGNMNANAGGYCHRSWLASENSWKRTVWFNDEMTPRYDWIWGGGNLFASLSIRYFCWQRCACENAPEIDNATLGLWAVVRDHEMMYRSDGGYNFQTSVDPGSSSGPSLMEILPAQNGAGSSSGRCGAGGQDFCPKAWNVTELGPIPRNPPNTTEVVKPQPPSKDYSVCGNACWSPADCGPAPSNQSLSCDCALPTAEDARTLGLDPVSPVAICMALLITSVKGNNLIGREEHGQVNGSGFEGSGSSPKQRSVYHDYQGVQHTCMCNSTFISDACCGSRDGIVHLS